MIVIINFKTYERGTGAEALKLAKICEEFEAWVAVQPTDIRLIASEVGVPVVAQHIDPVSHGKFTGKILPEAVKEAGAVGALINHSEDQISIEEIELRVKKCKELGLKSVVCAESVDEAKKYLPFGADLLAVELPEFIGTTTSIVSADPNIVKDAVAALGPNVLMGAGVNTGDDVKKSLDDGAAGVILASAVVQRAEDPREALKELFSKV